MINVRSILIGAIFGVILIKSEVASWERIQEMFAFQSPTLFLIIGSAIVTGAISLKLMTMLQAKNPDGDVIAIPQKKFNKGYVFGGMLFGTGWAITGACPGPIYAQVGSGEIFALITLVSAIVGTYVYSFLRPKLPH